MTTEYSTMLESPIFTHLKSSPSLIPANRATGLRKSVRMESVMPTQPLNPVGFFEDFFDQKNEQTSILWRTVNQRLADTA
ncbi:MAG: hypothetical protein R3F37_16205 [Candidatus Competibacteraceae bacterium]